MPRLTRFTGLAFVFAMLVSAVVATPTAAQAQKARMQAQWLFAADAARPGDTVHLALKIKIDEPWHVQSNIKPDEFTIPTELVVTPPPGFSLKQIVYPESKEFSVAGERALVFDYEFVIGIALTADETVVPGAYTLHVELNYQACDNRICLAPDKLKLQTEISVVPTTTPVNATHPEVFAAITFSDAPTPPPPPVQPVRGTDDPKPPPVVSHDCDVVAELNTFTVLGATGGYLNATEFIAFIDGAEQGTLKRNAFEGKGPLLIIVIVIIGGVLLNLTPCVLPLIPINLAIIGAGAQAGSRAKGFALGGAYGLAMAVVYGALGLIVTLTSTAFGTINSTIWFNVAIAILFVVLALAMFDIIAIDFTKYQSNIDATKVGKSGSLALAFFMGCVTALLAGACVAPVVIQVIVYAGDQYAKGITIALALPFFLGLGMALPWPFAGAGLSLLPKPGMWMVRVKQAMGVFILAFAAYYGWLAYEIWDSKRVDPAAVQSAVAEQLEGGWSASICAALAQARAENKPILIDMWATWCKNCLAMDKTTFKDPAVIARLEGFVKVKFQAEDLSATPAKEMLEKFEGIGLPTYAVLRPNAGAK